MCEHFSSTCVVAEKKSQPESEVVAFMTAYIPPEKPDTLFVWQVAVDASLRGQGIAKRLLADVLNRPAMQSIRFVEATVNPSNDASRNIFRSLAKQYQTDINEDLLFEASLLGDGDHEQENLVRVGPIFRKANTLGE
jgi:L-2,4-diaminobutyric acid acetyltransferase